MTDTLRRFRLECSHDNDNDFLVDDCPDGTYCYAADVERVVAENKRLNDKLNCNRCNKGHITLPLILWDCPACHDETRAALAAKDKRIAELEDDLQYYIEKDAGASL